MAYIQMKHSYKRYKTGDLEIIANNDVSFDIEKGSLSSFSVPLVQGNQPFLTSWVVWTPMTKPRHY